MPGLDGYNTCIRIRQIYDLHEADQPYIVACTGNVETSQINRAWESQFDELLQKPATIENLLTILSGTVRFEN